MKLQDCKKLFPAQKTTLSCPACAANIVACHSKWFEPSLSISSLYSVIVRVRVALKRIVVGG